MERRSNRFGFRQLVSVGCVLLMAGMGSVAMAQAPAPPPAQSQTFAPQQLDNLVAPIALYPDALVAQSIRCLFAWPELFVVPALTMLQTFTVLSIS